VIERVDHAGRPRRTFRPAALERLGVAGVESLLSAQPQAPQSPRAARKPSPQRLATSGPPR
jgi:hypothetical protein